MDSLHRCCTDFLDLSGRIAFIVNMDIEKKLLSLLDKPKCKQVFAFECIQMEGAEYLQWAEEVLLYSDDEEVNEAILELSPLMGSEINYFELVQALRAMMKRFGIIPPEGQNAVRLYLMGFCRLALDAVSAWTPHENQFYLEEPYSKYIYDSDPEMDDEYGSLFESMRFRAIYLDEEPAGAAAQLKKDYADLLRKYLSSHNICLEKNETEGLYINVVTCDNRYSL